MGWLEGKAAVIKPGIGEGAARPFDEEGARVVSQTPFPGQQ